MANISIANNKSKFPEGLRVLVVDDDPTFLKVLHTMLSRCLYQVTACRLASVALAMLREKKDSFDIVISDVNMPHMDGFTLLKQVELEMNLPVIMVSGNGDTSAVMKGIEHGACDYLIKPVRIHELKNIWQHVFRRKRNKRKELDHSGGVEDVEGQKRGLENANNSSPGTIRQNNHNEEEDHGDQENDPSTLKKLRFIWTRDLRQQFERAVNYLGIENAVPKKILELLPVKGLTREIVASHLQKYRLSRKRSYGGGYPQPALIYPPGVMPEANYGPKFFHGRFKVPTIIPSGQMVPQSWVALQNELSGSSKMNNELKLTEESLVQAPNEIVDCNPSNRITFGDPMMNNQTNNLQRCANQIEIEKYSQIQRKMSSLNDVGPSMSSTSSGFNKNFQKSATVDVASETVGHTCSSNYNYLVNQHENVFTFTEDLKLRVQPQSPQLRGTHALNLSHINCLQTQLLSKDFRPFSCITDSISGNDIIGCPSSLRMNHMSPLASVDNLENGSHPNIDNKNHDIPILSVENFSLSNSIGLPAPPSSIVRDFALQTPGLKSPSGIYETRTSQSMHIDLDEKINQSSKLDWEVESTSHDPDLSQIVSSTQFQGYSQAASGFDVLNVLRFQQRKVINLVTEKFDLPSRLAFEDESQSTIRSTQSQRDHNVADSGLVVKGGDISDLIGYREDDVGLLLDQFSPSYNTMDLILKQEGAMLEQGDYVIDG
ncbi:hypothetical protein SUGI_0739920 [Cryptomeria japonica]|uniref:two-component response regulator ORR21 isoform X2 n=1 Tax=Cryptomeria japonica TaxID=3369 RepID=UPI0024146AA7|nr:two-component response regulator ORR21 isoform X2 [Cryptomeria japonica]GLJ36745.1 hypothetical protein SUGI_0739920 [Cryptomeria japonica]